jgi:hypothetical protein
MSTMMPVAGPPEFTMLVLMVVGVPRGTGLGVAVVASAAKLGGPEAWTSKVAVAARSPDMATAQGPLPVQAPLQPAKVEPAAGVGVRVTVVPPA